MGRTKHFTLGLLIGAVAGSVVSLLYAPEKGKVVRKRLSYRVSTYAGEVNAMVDKLRKEREKLVSEAKDRGDKVVNEAQSKAQSLIREAETLLENASKSKPDRSRA